MRNDIHSPKNFKPADYEVEEHFGVMSVEGHDGEYHGEQYGYEAIDHCYHKNDQHVNNPHPDHDQCDVCGTRFVHGAVLLHKPSGVFITIGGQCLTTIAEVRHLTEGQRLYAAKKAHTRRMKAGKIRAMLGENPGLNAALKTDHYISRDLRESAIKWGSLSEKQVALAFKIAKDEANKPEEAPAVPMPDTDERRTVTATILGTKLVDGYMGGQDEKMLVQIEADGGAYKAYGTLPSAIADAQWAEEAKRREANPEADKVWPELKGAVITFTARFERSNKDECFGFIKRPTKITVVSWGDSDKEDK